MRHLPGCSFCGAAVDLVFGPR
ncbi:hypothetical protein RHECNPAF_3340070 [Rhizobium etli CNPAF512]|nr:hypothetical protein RHECNPAF_3340070 [Rhizobium etli CNPAF512]